MESAQAPRTLWPYFFLAASKITNFTINNRTEKLKKTPFQAFMEEVFPGKSHVPDLTNAFTPGSKIIAHVPEERRKQGEKLSLHGEPGMLLDWVYRDATKPWKIFTCFLHERPGTERQKVVVISSLTVYEVCGKSTSEFELTSTAPVIVDTIVVGAPPVPILLRHEAPAAKRNLRTRKSVSFATVVNDHGPQVERISFELAYATRESEIPITDPLTLSEALSGPNAKEWREALHKEFRNLLRLKVFRAVDRRARTYSSPPLTTKPVHKTKRDKEGEISEYKVRVVIRGFEQRFGVDYTETFASVSKAPTWRLLLHLAASLGWTIHQVDVVAAFLNGELDEDVYCEIPEGMAEFFAEFPEENDVGYDANEDQVMQCLKSLYGLKQAPRQWEKRRTEALAKLGFIQLKSDAAVYISYSLRVIIVTYVDDLLIMGPDDTAITKVVSDLGEAFELKDIGDVQYFLGIRITRNLTDRTITLSQDAYALRTLESLGYRDLRPAPTPFAAGSLALAVPNDGTADPRDVHAYQSGNGSLMHAMTQTRPDLCFLMGITSRYAHNPSESHQRLLQYGFRYWNSTYDYGLRLGGGTSANFNWDDENFTIDREAGDAVHVTAWVDASWKDDKTSGKSTFGYGIQVDDKLVAFKSKLSDRIMTSTTVSEYHATAKGVLALLWFTNLFTELRINARFIVKCDNLGTVRLTKNPEFHQRTGHIPLDELFVRDEVKSSRIELEWVATDEQLADGLTKPLTGAKHQVSVDRFGVVRI